MNKPKILRILLIILDAFLGLTAIAGGYGLLSGKAAPPVELLRGSPFDDYTIPGLALMAVGGQALLAAYWMWRQHPHAAMDSYVAGGLILLYLLLSVIFLGSPAGLFRGLQVVYLLLGVLILAFTAVFMRAKGEKTKPTRPKPRK